MYRPIGTEIGCRLSKALWGYEVELAAINPADTGRAMETMVAKGMMDLHFESLGCGRWRALIAMRGSCATHKGEGIGMPFAFAVAACHALKVEIPEVES